MKNVITLLLTTVLFIFLSSCGNDQSNTDAGDGEGKADEEMTSGSSVDLSKQAVCLWPTVGLRDKAGRSGAEYITGIKFGETVNLTGKEEEVASEKRTYLEMSLSDGKSGWAYEYLFAVGGKPVVAIADIDVFKRPDLSTLTTNKITSGSLFAVAPSEEQSGWAEVFTQEKKIAGWTQFNDELFTEEPIDIALGKVLAEVKGMKSNSEKIKRLESVSGSSTFSGSSLMPMVSEMMEKLDQGSNLSNTQLMIAGDNVNVRSAPDNTGDNVVFQLNDGDICDILEKGDLVTIGSMEDYWYHIEKDGQDGWVFGYFTSKRQ